MFDLTERSRQQIDEFDDLWPMLDRLVAEGRLIPVIGTGVRYALPDGYRFHIIELIRLRDGWTPETLRSGQSVGMGAPEGGNHVAIWGALYEQARRAKQRTEAASRPRRGKWAGVKPEALAVATDITSRRSGLTASSLAELVLDRLSRDHDKLPDRTTVAKWVADFVN